MQTLPFLRFKTSRHGPPSISMDGSVRSRSGGSEMSETNDFGFLFVALVMRATSKGVAHTTKLVQHFPQRWHEAAIHFACWRCPKDITPRTAARNENTDRIAMSR